MIVDAVHRAVVDATMTMITVVGEVVVEVVVVAMGVAGTGVVHAVQGGAGLGRGLVHGTMVDMVVIVDQDLVLAIMVETAITGTSEVQVVEVVAIVVTVQMTAGMVLVQFSC
jgi:hypothetical protein